MKITILSALLLLLSLTAAPAQSQMQMNQEANAAYEKADKKLNVLYQQVLKLYAKDAAFLKNFRASQQAWLRFRDAQVAALFPAKPGEAPNLTYGSIYPSCYAQVMQELTEARNRQLQLWVTGYEEGEMCAGSVRTK